MRRFDYDTLDSTSDQARRLMADHPGERLLVTAARQTAGRGRRGRTWQSPRGGVWLTLVWPVMAKTPDCEAAPLIAALATWRAVSACGADEARLRIKWPNDLLLDGRKVAGVLCERVFEPPAVLVGVGVNVNFPTAALPGNVRHPATTLRDALGGPAELPTVIECVAEALSALLGEFDREGFTGRMREAVARRLAWRGEAVSLHVGERIVQGVVRTVDDTGRLVLDVAGRAEAFAVGEVRRE